MTVFEAYITNLGKYAEGQLVGETLKFPATTEEVQSLLKNIGVDGVRYEEFFITAFDGDVIVAELFFNHSSTETFRDKLLKLVLADSSRLSASDGQEPEKTEILR